MVVNDHVISDSVGDFKMANRTFCDVLTEIRSCYKTRNFANLMGLVEELQSLGNRMEAGLWDQKDFSAYALKASEKKKEYKELREKVEALKSELGENE